MNKINEFLKNYWWVILILVVLLFIIMKPSNKKKPNGITLKEGDRCHIYTWIDNLAGYALGGPRLDGIIKNGKCV